MSISVQTNVASIRSQRNLTKVTNSFNGSIEKLSSGLRINRAGDDAARSAISSQMTAQERGLLQAKRNANDAISLVQDTESVTAHFGDVVTRLRELAVQASNEGTMDSTERGYLKQEFRTMLGHMDKLSKLEYGPGRERTIYPKDFDFQIGMNNTANDRISFQSPNVSPFQNGLGLYDGVPLPYASWETHLSSAADAQAAVDKLDVALESINTYRSSLGATQNRLETAISNLDTMYENMASSNSRLKDVDVADETAKFTRNQILSQAATSMLAQSNSLPQSALSLIG
jgi:flagellin